MSSPAPSSAPPPPPEPRGKSGKKICCSCPATKLARDACVVEKGEELCAAAIDEHKACLRAEGFVVK